MFSKVVCSRWLLKTMCYEEILCKSRNIDFPLCVKTILPILLDDSMVTEKSWKIVAKGEIACFDQFYLLSQCFQKLSAAEES